MLRSILIDHPPDVTKCVHRKGQYTLEEIMDICTDSDVIVFLVQAYEIFYRDLAVYRDEITQAIINYISLCNDYNMYTNSTIR